MQIKEFSTEVGGKTITAQFTNLADQTNGSVIMRSGNTAVLVTAVMGRESDKGYFPLSVEYEEKFYAAGAILGGRFNKREGKPSDEAVLSARIVDRTIRPLFDQALRRDIQIIVTVLSIDTEDPDVLAVIGASLALGTSNIPWGGPVSAARIGRKNSTDAFIINPSYADRSHEAYTLDVLACGKDGLVNMIEVGANEVPEEELKTALYEATKVHAALQQWQESIIKEIGVEKLALQTPAVPETVQKLFAQHIEPKMNEYVFEKNAAYTLKDEWMTLAKEQLETDVEVKHADHYFEDQVDHFVHVEAIKNNRRQDGRAMDEIRELYAQAGGISDIIHGTGMFFRGGTHVLSALTLGGPGDAQIIDSIESRDAQKRYMHHYNFPPFSVGETGRVGGFNRRQIGHGALAEKALLPVLPSKDVFPYTIRIVSETMASNGSSSMASVCGSTLALMDAGVPITKPVAGIAMGMMSDSEGNYKILTDIQGPEDHFGDMDFKVAGTKDGVTAVQMDVKVGGVKVDVLAEGLVQAKKARLHILDVIAGAIAAPRADINPRAPKIITLRIAVDQIGLVIGPGGKTINGIKDRTQCTEITIEDDGTVYITGTNGTAEAAAQEIRELTHVPQPGERYEGEVTRLMDFGAFVKINAHNEGLVHVSEIAPFRIANVSDAVAVGDKVPVIIKEIDEKGRINLSIKAADPDFAQRKGLTPSAAPAPHDRPFHKHTNHRGDRRDRF
jgi:polyribonucleotide nucleotidyltransferase